MKQPTREQWKIIEDCFAGWGEKPRRLSKSFVLSPCPHWRLPVMAPIFARRIDFSANELDSLSAYFRRNPVRHRYEMKDYFDVLIDGKTRFPDKLSRRVAARGWSPWKRHDAVCVWTRVRPFNLPRGYHLRTGPYADSAIRALFLKSMIRNFKQAPLITREIEARFREIGDRGWLTVICDVKGRPVASGAVAVHGRGAFLLCGSVDEKHRKKGLWTALIAARQAVSHARGARFWAMTTANPALISQGDWGFRHWVFERKAAENP